MSVPPHPSAGAAGTDPAPSGAVSLDDLATLLVQVEADDVAGLDELRTLVGRVAAAPSLPAIARSLIADAARLLGKAGRAVSPETFAETGRLIGIAVETVAVVESRVAAPAPAAGTPPAAPPPAAAEPTAPAPAAPATVDPIPFESDRELLGDFILESLEYLENAEAALLALETDPEDVEAVNTVFRAFHTIKGTSAFLGLDRISEFAHHAEGVLSRMRDGEIRCEGVYADLALRSADLMKELIRGVQVAMTGDTVPLPEGYDLLLAQLSGPAPTPSSEVENDGGATRIGDILVEKGLVTREVVEDIAQASGTEPLGLALVRADAAKVSDVAHALRKQKKAVEADATEGSVRVRTDRLDRLVDLVGELVVAQSMTAQDPAARNTEQPELSRKIGQVGKIVRELQDLSMAMRMVPLKPTFQKVARLVRDLAKKSGKQVEFVTEGEDTEIDRNMVDVISDPLVHMVRNALDHGIESPEDRTRAGKAPVGRVQLRAYHASGNVVVELQDDGRGLNRDKIVAKAVSKGMIESDKGMTDREVFNLIFTAGFSTADKITDISGRGVGMDVVRRNVEALRGRVDINSETGRGSVFSLRLPLTLAITDGMLVRVAEERYIIPIVNIHMSLRPTPEMVSTVIGRGEIVMLHGDVIPIIRLHRVFDVSGAVEEPQDAILVIVGAAERRCAVLVDELLGQQQFVAKSLGDGLGKVDGVAGGAILGDGRVGLILDPIEVVALATASASPAVQDGGSVAA